MAHGSGVAAAVTPPDISQKIRNGDFHAELGFNAVTNTYMDDTSKYDDLIKLMIVHHVRLEPNFVAMFKGVYPQTAKFMQEDLALALAPNSGVPAEFARSWETHYPISYPPTPDQMTKLKKGYENHQLFTRKFAAAGGKLFVGTDAWNIVAPGLAVWHEMELMADAGIPNLQILQGATINPAEFVHQDKNLATIEPGKLADIIILKANPLENISNIRTLETVIQHGNVQRLGNFPEYRNPIPRPRFASLDILPRPYIISVSPTVVPMEERQVLTIKGRDFKPENKIMWENKELHVVKMTPTEVQAEVPPELLNQIGTFKVHVETGGEQPEDSLNFFEILVSPGRKYDHRWNGTTMGTDFDSGVSPAPANDGNKANRNQEPQQ